MPALGPNQALIDEIRGSLPPDHEWDEREAALLELAQSQARDIDALEGDIRHHGVRVEGRGGQMVLNQALAEARMGRIAMARIVGLIDLPESAAPASVHGRKAAEARWRKAG